MKIHTTQNLASLAQQQHQLSTNRVSSKELRLLNEEPEQLSSDEVKLNVSFGKKAPDASKGKALVKETIKKLTNSVKDKAEPEKKGIDKITDKPWFDKMLDLAEYETAVQAAISCVVCIVLRPATIMALPSKKGKQDNMYASAHSMSSGFIGLLTPLFIANPFKNGANYAKKHMMQDMSEEFLSKYFPHLDLKSIYSDSAKKVRKPVKEWLDKTGREFSTEYKDVQKIPTTKQLADVSKETFEKVLGLKNIDFEAQKGKSFNEIVTSDGKKLRDVIDAKMLTITVEQEGIKPTHILIRDLDRGFAEQLIKDSKGTNSNWAKLDINSMYDANGKVKDFREWKQIKEEGETVAKDWILDLDTVGVSSALETADYIPRVSGKIRFDKKEQVNKFVTYQKNGVEDDLGTAIDEKMIDASNTLEILEKNLTWIPDIVTRPFVAAGTIALIPWMLKNVFHIEKSKKPQPQAEQPIQTVQTEQKAVAVEVEKSDSVNNKEAKENETAFKGSNNNPAFRGKGEKEASAFTKWLAKIYGKPLYESKWLGKFSEKLTEMPGTMTEHMATLGSLITSSVYVQQTLTKKDLDEEKRRTLAINQGLCFVIPTICAYTVNNLISKKVKETEYRYAGKRQHMQDVAKINKDSNFDFKKFKEASGTKLKGIRILASLATFTLIYRYLTPVLITPLANWIGNLINSKDKDNKSA